MATSYLKRTFHLDPSKIKVDLPEGDAASCYSPIVQSGGTYDLRVSAASTEAKLSDDIIIVSLGARYKNYCSNISRSFLVDPPKKVQKVSNSDQTLAVLSDGMESIRYTRYYSNYRKLV